MVTVLCLMYSNIFLYLFLFQQLESFPPLSTAYPTKSRSSEQNTGQPTSTTIVDNPVPNYISSALPKVIEAIFLLSAPRYIISRLFSVFFYYTK